MNVKPKYGQGRKGVITMKIERPCNLDVPTGATPMTIADAILRECDEEVLRDVLYYIDCFLKTCTKNEVMQNDD